jgi:O-acetyl-ADP-ribose deacetylase (regulator of RNase III)
MVEEISERGRAFWRSEAEWLVNPINTVGKMGRGIALEFKTRFPLMFRDYVSKCNSRSVVVGKPYIFCNKIVMFPTKDHYMNPSKEEWISEGIDHLFNIILGMKREERPKSIAFPALGCGTGGLSWDVVRPIMLESLEKFCNIGIKIEIFTPDL